MSAILCRTRLPTDFYPRQDRPGYTASSTSGNSRNSSPHTFYNFFIIRAVNRSVTTFPVGTIQFCILNILHDMRSHKITTIGNGSRQVCHLQRCT